MRLGLSINEFWELTPYEISLIAEARKQEKEEQLQILAWAVSLIISYTGRLKRPITADKLLGKQKEHKIKRIANKEEEWQKLLERFAD